jgi:hypothetical protein
LDPTRSESASAWQGTVREQATIKLNLRSVFNFQSFRVAGDGVEDGATKLPVDGKEKTQRWVILIVALTLPQSRDQLEFY